MILSLFQSGHLEAYNRLQQVVFTNGVAGRLALSAALGFAIGLDRELHHRPSGIRTNVLICFGASMFTFLSIVIAGEAGNRGQIASNIVQGIGFLGAGLILHNRDRVSGLTSAATVWSVASIGMACGAGLYVPAVFATVLVLVVLEVVRQIEFRASIKLYTVIYEVRGADAAKITMALLGIMDRENRRLASVENESIGGLERLAFPVSATDRVHRRLKQAFQAAPVIDEVHAFRDPEDE
ncbi:MAG TPA: MgtC/SapB family protein [Acidobacteriaceae bacterium]|nr:MgtC/SapB family protein [Acidobacteriaceae bacterium]